MRMLYKNFIKVLFDVIFSLIVIIVLSPLYLFLILLLSISNKGTPFFTQERPGLNGKTFKVIKFKTMNDRKDSEGRLLPDEERLTRIGKIVRKFSLDELPQLFNIIKGNMSLIGPRPLLPEYLALYNDIQKHRHDVRPGMTGWAQVNGRNAISWKEKFEHDVWYVDHLSFWLDVKIFFITIKKVLMHEDINSRTSATMVKFNGSN